MAMFTSISLLIAGLGLAQAQDTGSTDSCDKWGKIVPENGTTGQVGSDALWFEVGGQECPGVDPTRCEWYLLPDDGTRGQLPQDNLGGSMQWLPPGGVDSCPPMKATLIVECVDLDGDNILTNYANLRVDDSNNRCDLMGGGCISPSSQAGGVFLMMPLLWFVGRRKDQE
jgi:hypothetical protein